MTNLRPTPMDRAPHDPTAPLLGPGQWHCEAPVFRKGEVPAHVALIMDGNGRWANSRGLARTEGHRAGEYALMDTIAGAIDAGVRYLSVYTFSTENWKRSPAEVSFIMNYASDVLARRTDQLAQWGVHVRWSGRRPKLWKSVINALEKADRATSHCKALDLVMCVNYGGRAELADAARSIAEDVAAGRLSPRGVTEKTLSRHLYLPDVPDVDLMIRTSGEQRLSNYLLWQMAYAEMMFVDTPWPAFDREELWGCLEEFAGGDGSDRRGEDSERAEAVQQRPQDAPRDHGNRVGAPAHAHQACARVDRRLDAHRQEAQGNDDDAPLVEHGRALAGNRAVKPAGHGAQETLTAGRQDGTRGCAAGQPVGRLRTEEYDEEEENEEPDTLACKGGDHGIDSGGEHDTPRVRLIKQSLS